MIDFSPILRYNKRKGKKGFIMTHASRDASTGLDFEKKIRINKQGIDLSQTKLYKFLKEKRN